MKHARTFRIDRLYHRFLKPQGISIKNLGAFIVILEAMSFIKTNLEKDRYEETPRLSEGESKKDLFKIIQKLKEHGL